MLVRYHVAASGLLAAVLYAAFRSVPMALAAAASGVLVDADHVLDYLVHPRRPLRPAAVFSHFRGKHYRQVILLFHGWEWVLLLAGAAWAAGRAPWLIGLTAGLGLHLAMDQASNGGGIAGYSFFWRLAHGFERPAFHPRERAASSRHRSP